MKGHTHPGVAVAFLAYQMISPLFPTYFIFPRRLFSFRIYLFIDTTALKGRYVVILFVKAITCIIGIMLNDEITTDSEAAKLR